MDSIHFDQVVHPNIAGEMANMFQDNSINADISALPARYYHETDVDYIVQFRDSGEEAPVPDEIIVMIHVIKDTLTIRKILVDFFPSRAEFFPAQDGNVHWVYFPEVLSEADLDMYQAVGAETSRHGHFAAVPAHFVITEAKIEEIAGEIPSKADIYKYQEIFPV